MKRVVDIAIEREVVGALAIAPLVVDAIEDDGLDAIDHGRGIDLLLADLARDVLLLVSEERVALTRASDVVLLD